MPNHHQPSTVVRNRIQDLRRVRAGDLQPHPKNWRTHPQPQIDALRGVLQEIGYAAALLARELPDGRLQLIDGHARRDLDPEQTVPVLVTDLDEQEAAKLLLTLDPLAAMAEADADTLRRLVREVQTDDPALRALIDDLVKRNADETSESAEKEDRPAAEIPSVLQILVECESEQQQQELFQRLREEGYTCRLLTL